MAVVLLFPFDYLVLPARAQSVAQPQSPIQPDSVVYADAEILVKADEVTDSIPPTEVTADDYPYGLDGKIAFNPSPQRAVWLSALCPGLGQIYNRRYWKLPIVVGGFMGLGYATNWNNNQYQDYVQGYRDLVDSDPNTKSYLDFFPPTVNESDLDTEWLTRTFKSRRDYFRRNRPVHHLHCGVVSGVYGRCVYRCFYGAFRHLSRPFARYESDIDAAACLAQAGVRNQLGIYFLNSL